MTREQELRLLAQVMQEQPRETMARHRKRLALAHYHDSRRQQRQHQRELELATLRAHQQQSPYPSGSLASAEWLGQQTQQLLDLLPPRDRLVQIHIANQAVVLLRPRQLESYLTGLMT